MCTILDTCNSEGKKCSAKDIVSSLNLNVSLRTAQRTLKNLHFEYRLFKRKYQLNTLQRRKRIELSKTF